ncbi:MAG: isoprenylcysteine carboxylmethyltransferase family protein [candidate division KSB1 bacterium]|nr:isoprenylcysteine carboxylmethyltransferase family protein [candidate division KSB1 bacterium]
MIKIFIFGLCSILFLLYSWKSLKSYCNHGFFRFFAFEGILILVLLNVNYWFDQPFVFRQIISWLLLTISLVLAIHGFYLLHIIGKPRQNFEDTSVLVKVGAYRYIRHPLYASLLAGAWGAWLKHISIVSVLLVLLITGLLYATAKIEEKENLEKFGDAYRDYMKNSRMFIPFFPRIIKHPRI